MAKYIGIDLGSKRSGLAITDITATFARPLEVCHGEKELLRRLGELVEEEEIVAFVLGLPRNMDGSIGPKAEEVQAFGDRLVEALKLPVHYEDERLTSVQAESMLREAGKSPSQRRELVDQVAARIILQSYIDAHNPPRVADSPT